MKKRIDEIGMELRETAILEIGDRVRFVTRTRDELKHAERRSDWKSGLRDEVGTIVGVHTFGPDRVPRNYIVKYDRAREYNGRLWHKDVFSANELEFVEG